MTNFWYIIFTNTEGRMLCGYYTVKYLRQETHGMVTIHVTEYRPAPANFEIDKDYNFVADTKSGKPKGRPTRTLIKQ